MSDLEFNKIRRAAALWLGPLAEPALIGNDEMLRAAGAGSLIWDVRDEASHRNGHPAGARSLGSVDWLLAEPSGANLVPAAVIVGALERIGIAPGADIVVYSDADPVSAFIAVRALRCIGVRKVRICFGELDSPSVGSASSAASPAPSSARAARRTGEPAGRASVAV